VFFSFLFSLPLDILGGAQVLSREAEVSRHNISNLAC